MIAQITQTAQTALPPFIYPDPDDRGRAIVFTVAKWTRTEILAIDVTLQIRHASRRYLGLLERNGDGWQVANADGTAHETPEAAAMAAYEIYQDQKRAAIHASHRD